MKNNLSYYRHEVNSHNHWKFKTLRRKYQWSGEGKFWALNNMIGESDGCRLDISNADKKASIAADLDFDVSEFDSFLECLISTCKLVIIEDGHLTTPMTQENLCEVNEKRERQRLWKKNKSTTNTDKSTSTTPKPSVDLEQSKVKESILKESKVEESKVNTAVSPALPVPKKNRGSKKKPDAEPYWPELIKVYFSFCFEKFNEKPSFGGSDPSDMHRIIECLKKRAADQGVEWSQDVATLRWRGFLGTAYQDDWLAKNWLLSHLNRQKDKIFLNLINQKNGTHQKKAGTIGQTIEFD